VIFCNISSITSFVRQYLYNYYPKYERCNYRHLKIMNISHLTRLFIERTKTLFKEWTPDCYCRVTFTSRGHTWRYLSGDRVNFPEDFRFFSQSLAVNTQTGVPPCNRTRLIPSTTSPIHRLQFLCHPKLHCNRDRMTLLLRPPLNNIGRQSRVCQADFQFWSPDEWLTKTLRSSARAEACHVVLILGQDL
jgi:hypothetical protein